MNDASSFWKRPEVMNLVAESPIYQQIQAEGYHQGLVEGLLQAVKLGLELRFGTEGTALFAEVQKCNYISLLKQARKALAAGDDIQTIKQLFS